MEHLWAPWRMAYIEPQTPQPQGCIFCTLPAEHRDAENYILYRGTLCFMMLNRYPYNNGHLMIAPYQHVPSIMHMHVVPRWYGDTNFMPVIADTKVLPELLSSVYEKLKRALDALRDSPTEPGVDAAG